MATSDDLRIPETQVSRFAPRASTRADQTIGTTIQLIRQLAKQLNEACDQMDALLNSTDSDAKQSAEALMAVAKKLK